MKPLKNWDRKYWKTWDTLHSHTLLLFWKWTWFQTQGAVPWTSRCGWPLLSQTNLMQEITGTSHFSMPSEILLRGEITPRKPFWIFLIPRLLRKNLLEIYSSPKSKTHLLMIPFSNLRIPMPSFLLKDVVVKQLYSESWENISIKMRKKLW